MGVILALGEITGEILKKAGEGVCQLDREDISRVILVVGEITGEIFTNGRGIFQGARGRDLAARSRLRQGGGSEARRRKPRRLIYSPRRKKRREGRINETECVLGMRYEMRTRYGSDSARADPDECGELGEVLKASREL